MLFLQLANVPGRGRPPWETVLLETLRDGMRGLKTVQDEPVFQQAHWYYSGVLSVRLNLGADPAAVSRVLERAVADASTHYANHVLDSAEREAKRRQLEESLRGLMTEATIESAIFGEANVVRDEWIGTLGLLAFIPVRASTAGADPLESYYVQQAFSAHRPHLADLHLRDGNIVFAVNEMTEAVATAIRAAIANAGQQVAHLRRIRMEQARAHGEFATSIRERFGALPTAD
jgi:hypothetical protein